MGNALIGLLAAIGGLSGIAALVTAVVRARSGAHVDEAEAADKIVSAGVSVVQLLRGELDNSHADAKEARQQSELARHRSELAIAAATAAQRDSEEARRLHERCEELRKADSHELAQQSTHLGELSARLIVLESTLGTLGVAVDDVRTQVTTANSKTLAVLADEGETRRIEDIPQAERTDAETEHLTASPPIPAKGEPPT